MIQDNIFKGIFLLILSISGNFLAETFSCQTQKLLYNNMFVKNILVFFLIYFALGFSDNKTNSPLHLLKISSIVFIFYLLFSKMDIRFTIITFVLMTISYIINNQIEYEKNKDNKKDLSNIKKIRNILYSIIIIFIISGFSIYFLKQKKNYKNRFSFVKFIFGKSKCRSIK